MARLKNRRACVGVHGGDSQVRRGQANPLAV